VDAGREKEGEDSTNDWGRILVGFHSRSKSEDMMRSCIGRTGCSIWTREVDRVDALKWMCGALDSRKDSESQEKVDRQRRDSGQSRDQVGWMCEYSCEKYHYLVGEGRKKVS
jgi:hypothetical protein